MRRYGMDARRRRPSGSGGPILHRRKFPDGVMTPVFRDTWFSGAGFLPVTIRTVRGRNGKIAAITVGSGRVRRVRVDRLTGHGQ